MASRITPPPGSNHLYPTSATGRYILSPKQVADHVLAKVAALRKKELALQANNAALRRQLEEDECLRQQLKRLQRPPGGGS